MLNVPPTWAAPDSSGAAGGGGPPPFAPVRPGVLWPCHQVESSFTAVPAAGGAAGAAGASGRKSGGGGGRSWSVDENDPWGRTLPSQGYAAGGGGGARLAAGGFVSQDNTEAAAARLRAGGDGGAAAAAASATPPEAAAEGEVELDFQAAEFRVSRGTLLTDECAGGDVEAVMAGRAAVGLVQTWPASHPFTLRDELLVWALEGGGAEGLPLWLDEGL
jgi:hypothetical protein